MEPDLGGHYVLTIFGRLLISILCGGLIGLERELARKQVDLRTLILICLGSTLYMTVSQLAALNAGQEFDITRVAAQVVTGVGFIGAGTIIQARGQIHGLTTAATIWTVAAIGLIVGAGFPWVGLGVTLIVLIILVLIRRAERYIANHWIGKVEEENEGDSETLPKE